jgi:alanine racemase
MRYEIGEKVIYLGRESTVQEVDNELNTMRIETSCGLTKWISQSDV